MAFVAALCLDELLTELRLRGWTLYVFGPKEAPKLVAAVLPWIGCTDVLIIRSEEHAAAYRVAAQSSLDVFKPSVVAWQYHSSA